ncbi:Hpt domain-containing protein [Pelagibaculum spongiae]|nr:Hpt domain-containing protein [Pelagibaculum spongiae]
MIGQSEMQHLDNEVLDELQDIMGKDFSLLISTFVSDSLHRFESMRDHWVAGDMVALSRDVHSLKGSSSNVGAVSLSEFCQQLEVQVKAGEMDSIEMILDMIGKERSTVCQLMEVFL